MVFIGKSQITRLELDHLTFAFLVASKLEMFTSLERNLFTELAFRTLHTKHDFLRSLGLKNELVTTRNRTNSIVTHLLPEDRFRLATETLLFPIVTPPALGGVTFLRFFILCDFVQLVHLALLAKGATLLRYVHLNTRTK